ncbi:DUF805 domain-containing protein [Ulvibacter antarcticus]|uniref:Uncharacterized membrane protein YhaH (DUF805 family) n=1 Tax=Ulvibacter antarcticus TaxID=442714 RepID=A0A3L9YGE5_9FLAO|nr:DUF805 domain-containing protein [Ulvibacter antarcticus]RMA57185.1 uncharacterized membrane protein YhaH (DUF805 family) [Ulvibacter antarcticus]
MIIEKQEKDYTIYDWWRKVMVENYANFDGRARRSEYWYFSLFNFIIIFSFAIIMAVLSSVVNDEDVFLFSMIPLVLGFMVILIPSIAVAVRRLHDTGKSGWYYLLGVIPIVSYVGGIVLLVFYCSDGDRGDNQYGLDPKKRNLDF